MFTTANTMITIASIVTRRRRPSWSPGTNITTAAHASPNQPFTSCHGSRLRPPAPRKRDCHQGCVEMSVVWRVFCSVRATEVRSG